MNRKGLAAVVAAPAPCTETARPANEPSLAGMTSKAIQLLENRRGFFLQVEGASIDKQDHATNACGQLGETVAFDKAIGWRWTTRAPTRTRSSW